MEYQYGVRRVVCRCVAVFRLPVRFGFTKNIVKHVPVATLVKLKRKSLRSDRAAPRACPPCDRCA